MDKSSSSCVDLEVACKVLARSPAVRDLVKQDVGDEHFPAALEAMRAGKPEGDLGATVHDLLIDAIPNDGTVVWSGVIRQPHDDYPVTVNGYHGDY